MGRQLVQPAIYGPFFSPSSRPSKDPNMPLRKRDLHYQVIALYYGGQTAKRSGVPYMNHIDEGLAILEQLDASVDAMRAFCLHPIVQADQDMRSALAPDSLLLSYRVDLAPIALAIEYRVVANAYLSTQPVPSKIEDILLSTLPEVNQMLVADKVQNRKDFEAHHRGQHPRSREIERYFRTWLERLGVSEEMYRELAKAAGAAPQLP